MGERDPKARRPDVAPCRALAGAGMPPGALRLSPMLRTPVAASGSAAEADAIEREMFPVSSAGPLYVTGPSSSTMTSLNLAAVPAPVGAVKYSTASGRLVLGVFSDAPAELRAECSDELRDGCCPFGPSRAGLSRGCCVPPAPTPQKGPTP
jgi:hypothetical protein